MPRLVAKLGALLVCGFLGAVFVPGCVIRIGPGTETDEPGGIDTQDPPVEAGEPENSNMPTQEDLDNLAQADPQQVALGKAKAAFTAYNTMGLIATNTADPSQLDEEAMGELINYYAPLAWAEAEKWAATIDLTTLDAPPVYYAGECAEPPYDCEGRIACPFAKVCVLTSCGLSNECGPCPSIFDLGKIATYKWCAYTCVVGKEVVVNQSCFGQSISGLGSTIVFPAVNNEPGQIDERDTRGVLFPHRWDSEPVLVHHDLPGVAQVDREV